MQPGSRPMSAEIMDGLFNVTPVLDFSVSWKFRVTRKRLRIQLLKSKLKSTCSVQMKKEESPITNWVWVEGPEHSLSA